MTRDEALKLVGVLKRTAISFHESRTDDALIRALDAEDALIAALSAPAAGEDVEPGFDDETATKIFKWLAETLGVNDWHIQDGSETWDGDVSATLRHILHQANVVSEEDGSVARLRAVPQGVPNKLMAALATVFHGYCTLEDGDQKFAMRISPDWTWQHRHPSECVRAWGVIRDVVYPDPPAAPAPEKGE
jgi:hypothetical protein